MQMGAMKGWAGSPSASSPGHSGWGPAKNKEQAGRRLRAAMRMPQVGVMARPPSLDSDKDS